MKKGFKKGKKKEEIKFERKPFYPESISEESLNDLLVAVINAAWTDLLSSSSYLKRNKITDEKNPDKKQINALFMANEARRFFNSEWFNEMTNDRISPCWIFEALSKAVEIEDAGKRRTASYLIKKRIESAIIY